MFEKPERRHHWWGWGHFIRDLRTTNTIFQQYCTITLGQLIVWIVSRVISTKWGEQNCILTPWEAKLLQQLKRSLNASFRLERFISCFENFWLRHRSTSDSKPSECSIGTLTPEIINKIWRSGDEISKTIKSAWDCNWWRHIEWTDT